MPKMFNWAKKIAGRSSTKDTGHDPETNHEGSPKKTQSPEKKSKLDTSLSSIGSDEISSRHNSVGHSSPAARLASEKGGPSEVPNTNSRTGPSSEHLLNPDSRPSSERRHYSESRPSPEKRQQVSVKKTSSFTKRLASFRFPSLDRNISGKRSRSKSKSPEMVTPQKSPSHVQNPSIPCQKPPVGLPTGAINQNLPVKDPCESNGRRVVENGSEIDESLLRDKSPIYDNLITNTTSVTAEEKVISPLQKVNGRKSISEKLYGEVIREFDKRRSTKPRLASSEVCEVTENPESVNHGTQKAHSHRPRTLETQKAHSHRPRTLETQKAHSNWPTKQANGESSESSKKECLNNNIVNDSVRTRVTGTTNNPYHTKICQVENESKDACQGVQSDASKRCESKGLQTSSEITSTKTDTENRTAVSGMISSATVHKYPQVNVHNASIIKNWEASLRTCEENTNITGKDCEGASTAALPEVQKPDAAPENNVSPLQQDEVPPVTCATELTNIIKELSSLGSDGTDQPPNLPPQSEVKFSSDNEDITALLDPEPTEVPPLPLSGPPQIAEKAPVPDESDLNVSEVESSSLPTNDSSLQVKEEDQPKSLLSISMSCQNSDIVQDSSSSIVSPNVDHKSSCQTTESVADSLFAEISDIETDLSTVAPVLFSEMLKLSDENKHTQVQETTDVSCPDGLVESTSVLEKAPESQENAVTELHIYEDVAPVSMSLSDNKEEIPSKDLSEEKEFVNALQNKSVSEENSFSDSLENLSESIPKTSTPDNLQVTVDLSDQINDGEPIKEDTGAPSNDLTNNDTGINKQSEVHTDPLVSCYSLEESPNTFKTIPVTIRTKDPIPTPRSTINSKIDGNFSETVRTLPKASPRRHFENFHRSSEEVSSQTMTISRQKGSGGKPEISEPLTESGEYMPSEEGGSLPASPSVPRRRRKSRMSSAAGSLQTLSIATSSEKLSQRNGSERDLDRSRTPNQAPPRPPLPASAYSPSHSTSTSSLSSPEKAPATADNTRTPSPKTHTPESVKKEPINPFDDDDDYGSEEKAQPKQPGKKVSLNPFGSDDEDNDQASDSSPSKDTKSEVLPAGYNPFDDDDDHEIGEDSSLQNAQNRTDVDPRQGSTNSHNTGNRSTTPSKSAPANPFDEDEDERKDTSFDENYFARQTIGRQSLAIRSSSPFQREGVRASLPCTGRGRSSKKRLAPLPPGYQMSPSTTPFPPRSTMKISGPSPVATPLIQRNAGMRHGESSTSLYWSPMRKDSRTTSSNLSLASSSPRKPAPPRPPPPRIKSVSLAQL